MSRGTPTGPTLVKDLQAQLKSLTADLRNRSDQADDPWAQDLKAEYERARERGRTGLTWSEWRDGEVNLAAVAWVLATVFVRFCEDNGLIDGPWITGEGTGHAQAADNETAFYQADPTRNSRDWLRAGFAALADLPAGRDLLDRRHNLVWRAPISADAASALLAFWRKQDADGSLVHDFTDPALDTRFLGDLYQDLSDYAKKKYALLQTPVFVEEFILDRTLTPAMEEFGLEGLKLIDPTCGSGHFLLGAFDRLLAAWRAQAPAMDTRERVQRALDSIHGVDLNPFAVAIARFRLTVAALKASGLTLLKDAPAFEYHLAVGDSLIRHGVQTDLLSDGDEFSYANEDVAEHPGILDRGKYHVVVGNPPYITVKDKVLNERYRQDYRTCKGKYALSVPFMELFFDLASKAEGDMPAGWVGQITSNSFMKREFGSKLIEDLLSGTGALAYSNPVDLTYVIDTAGAYIPGHGTPTVILIGRHRRPVGGTVRAILGVRGEPGQPEEPAKGLVWSEICKFVEVGVHDGEYVSVRDMDRGLLATHPWSLSGGGAGELKEALEGAGKLRLGALADAIGIMSVTGEDGLYMLTSNRARLLNPAFVRTLVEGEVVRDFRVSSPVPCLWPYGEDLHVVDIRDLGGVGHALWLARSVLNKRKRFGTPMVERGLTWWEWQELYADKMLTPLSLTFAFVATHNHFVLDRGGKVFNRSAPVIKLRAGATEDEYLDLLGVLNSSTACFWLMQVSHNKGEGGGARVDAGYAAMGSEAWKDSYEFTGTKLQEFPLPGGLPRERARHLDALAQRAAFGLPAEALRSEVSRAGLAQARETWLARRAQMVFEQEELDWEVYRLYGLVDEDLTYSGGGIEQLALGERAFEIALARKVAEGSEETAWFERHGSTPITDLPAEWPADYRALVQQRLDLIASDPFIGLLERPEYKRRWQSATWDDLLPDALQSFILDRLEESALWSDASGPAVMSIAQLADRVRGDADLVEAVRLLRDAVEVDLTKELGKLLADEAVPFLAALRYKDSGMRKRAEWETVWDLQRREDSGETVSIPVPPKYGQADFRKASYWKARGKLDVPKERFISYPGAERPGDSSMVIGWAGWDHLDQARALARLIVERTQGEGMSPDQVLPLVAGLVELEPWLHQWHAEPDAAFGGMSPATFLTGFIDSQLAALGATRTDAKAWRP
jgi:hypothetical protein